MKKFILSIVTALLLSNVIQAQNDTVYFMKNGIVINKQSIKPTDVDSMIFYNPPQQPISNIVDGDGNTYTSVIIGTQTWLVENLKTTKYNDGTPIANVTDNNTWPSLTSPAYCWYYNDSVTYKDLYGALYNWYAIDLASNGGKNICPVGWHVPSDAEWTTLINYLGGSNVAGGLMKEAGTTHWVSPNTGATNASGFTALPSGCRSGVAGTFITPGYESYFWTSTPVNSSFSWYYYLFYATENSYRYSDYKTYGYSIRCVKD